VSELRKYGVLLTTAKAIQFTLYQIDGVDIEPAATFATGDIKISKDGGAEVNTTNLPADEGQGYSLILTLAELQARRIRLFIVDQTATKVWLDIDINIETYGHASAMHAFDLNDNVRPDLDAMAIVLAFIKLKTDSLTFTVANEVDSNVITKTGFSLAATGLDAIVSTATGAIEIAKAMMDRVLTGLTHNIPDSLGRRVRNLQEFGSYEDNRVWIDTIKGTSGTTDYESGTILNKVDNVTDSNTLGASLGLDGRGIAPGSSITFIASQDAQDWKGNVWTLALGGQSISDSHIFGATVSGICTGINPPEFHDCEIGNVTVPPCKFRECSIDGIITLPVGEVHMKGSIGESGAVVDYGVAVANTTVHWTNFSGDLIIDNLGQNGVDILDIRGHGKITFNASCIGGTVNWDGHFTIVDDGSGITFNGDDISTNVDALPGLIGDLNDPTAAAVAAAVATYDMGNGRTIEEALAFLRNKWEIINGILTVYDTDDTTILWTSAMTQTAGDPVSGSDPV